MSVDRARPGGARINHRVGRNGIKAYDKNGDGLPGGDLAQRARRLITSSRSLGQSRSCVMASRFTLPLVRTAKGARAAGADADAGDAARGSKVSGFIVTFARPIMRGPPASRVVFTPTR